MTSAGIVGALTAVSLSIEGHRFLTAVLALTGAVLLVSALLHLARKGRAPAPSLLAVATMVALALSLVAAQMAGEDPNPPHVELAPIALWLVALGALVTSITVLSLRDSSKPAWRLLRANAGELLAVLGICLAGFSLRAVDLAGFPSPFSGDEAQFLLQAERVGRDEIRNLFASGYQGHPNLFWWALYGTTRLFGDSMWGARMFGVLVGTAALGVIYLQLRSMFSKMAGLLGAAYFSAYHFPLQYSRQDMNNICDVLTTALVIFFAWRAFTLHKPRDYVATGFLSGLGLYMYAGARAVPVILAAAFFVVFILQSQHRLKLLQGAAYVGASLTVAVAPLALFWYDHPDEFSNRLNEIGIYQSGWLRSEEAKTGKSELSILVDQAKSAFGAFGRLADRSPFYKGPMPLVDHLSLVFFLVGAAIAIAHFHEVRYLLLILSFVIVVILGSVLTVEPPQSQRLLGTAPVVTAFVVDGVILVSTFVSRSITSLGFWRERPPEPSTVGSFLAVVTIAVLILYNGNYYFRNYRNGDYYSDFNTRIAWVAGQTASAAPVETLVFWEGAPFIYVGHPTFAWQVRRRTVYDVLDDGKIVPALKTGPTGPAVLMAVEGRRADFARAASACPGGRQETIKDDRGRTLFLMLEVNDSACLTPALAAVR